MSWPKRNHLRLRFCCMLWGVGPKTAERLESLGIHTIGQLAQQSEKDLVRRFGKHGHDLSQYARGIDPDPIETVREAKSISKETTFSKDVDESVRWGKETQRGDA